MSMKLGATTWPVASMASLPLYFSSVMIAYHRTTGKTSLPFAQAFYMPGKRQYHAVQRL